MPVPKKPDDPPLGPVRRIHKVRETVNRDGQPETRPLTDEEDRLDEDGALSHTKVVRDTFWGCGCPASGLPGNQCRLCDRISCPKHALECAECGMPLCRECAGKRTPPRCCSCRRFRLFGGRHG
jgi:hypothetical protein